MQNGTNFIGDCEALRVSIGALIMMKGPKRTTNLCVLHGTVVIGDVVIGSPMCQMMMLLSCGI